MVAGIYTGRWVIPSVEFEVRHEYCSSEQGPLPRPMIRIVRGSPLKYIIPSKVHRSTFAVLIVYKGWMTFFFSTQSLNLFTPPLVQTCEAASMHQEMLITALLERPLRSHSIANSQNNLHSHATNYGLHISGLTSHLRLLHHTLVGPASVHATLASSCSRPWALLVLLP